MNPLGREEQTPFNICPEINKLQRRVSRQCIKLHRRCNSSGKRKSHNVTAVNTLGNSAFTLQEMIQQKTKLHLTPTQQPSCRVDLNTTDKKTQNLTFVCPCIASIIVNDDQQDTTILAYLFIHNQLYMFRAMFSSIIRST